MWPQPRDPGSPRTEKQEDTPPLGLWASVDSHHLDSGLLASGVEGSNPSAVLSPPTPFGVACLGSPETAQHVGPPGGCAGREQGRPRPRHPPARSPKATRLPAALLQALLTRALPPPQLSSACPCSSCMSQSGGPKVSAFTVTPQHTQTMSPWGGAPIGPCCPQLQALAGAQQGPLDGTCHVDPAGAKPLWKEGQAQSHKSSSQGHILQEGGCLSVAGGVAWASHLGPTWVKPSSATCKLCDLRQVGKPFWALVPTCSMGL